MKSEELQAYLELAQQVGAFKPIVRGVIDQLKMYEEEVNEITDFFVNNTVKNKARIFNGFIEAGLTREEALALTINASLELKEAMKSAQSRKKAN